MQSDDSQRSPLSLFVRKVVIVIAITGLAALSWRLRDMLLLILGAVLVAVIFRALADPLHRRMRLAL